jgi:hypothetical protein
MNRLGLRPDPAQCRLPWRAGRFAVPAVLACIALSREPAQSQTKDHTAREQIGEVLGRPVYRDEINDASLLARFLDPVIQKYQDAHRADITPTDGEIRHATEVFNRMHQERLAAEGGEAKIRNQLQDVESQLARDGLSEVEARKLKSKQISLQSQLKPPGRAFAEFMLNHWKFQKHLYETYGGGRILWQQAGQEAFDATRRWLESLEQQGEFKISDPRLRRKFYEYWTRDHGPFLTSDKDRIRREFLEPPWAAPVAAKPLKASAAEAEF